ncbi:MAG: hypothetical protein ACK4Y6_00945, partial [Bacteroidota bacterium]
TYSSKSQNKDIETYYAKVLYLKTTQISNDYQSEKPVMKNCSIKYDRILKIIFVEGESVDGVKSFRLTFDKYLLDPNTGKPSKTMLMKDSDETYYHVKLEMNDKVRYFTMMPLNDLGTDYANVIYAKGLSRKKSW